MYIEKRIKLGKKIFFLRFNVIYKKRNSKYICLALSDYNPDYFDSGDISIMIKVLEEKYKNGKKFCYDACIPFMNDVIFIYKNMPFISGVREAYYSSSNELIDNTYISKEDIEEYLKINGN